jgi:hypothetical protein
MTTDPLDSTRSSSADPPPALPRLLASNNRLSSKSGPDANPDTQTSATVGPSTLAVGVPFVFGGRGANVRQHDPLKFSTSDS